MELGLISVFQEENRDVRYYDIVEYSEDYLDMRKKVLSLEELKGELSRLGEAKRDFDIRDGTFLCNPMIQSISVGRTLINTMRSAKCREPSNNSLYRLLARGVSENFFVVEDGLSGECSGMNGVIHFRNIHFSQGTMTVYAQLHSEKGFYNKMIVKHADGVLTFVPFRFATDQAVTGIPSCIRLNERLIINGKEFQLWQTELLSVYDDSIVMADCLINYGLYEQSVYQDVLKLLSTFIRRRVVCQNEQREWVGSGTSYKSDYGVYFKTSYRKMNADVRSTIEDLVYDMADRGLSETSVASSLRESMENRGYSAEAVYAALVLLQVVRYQGTTLDVLKNALSLENKFKQMIFWRGLYLYRVRSNAFLEKKSLAPFARPILFGGRTKEYTQVKAMFYY